MKKNSSQSGFSLVETLVSITILLLVIGGPLAITSNSVKSTNFSNEQVIAFFLAQEGIEFVQKHRDDLFLDYYSLGGVNPWPSFLSTTLATNPLRLCYIALGADPLTTTGGCGLSQRNGNIGNYYSKFENSYGLPENTINCATGDCRLRLNPTVGVRSKYTHNISFPLTPYTRRITIQIINANEIKVTSTVKWRSGSIRAEQKVSAETHLFNTI